MLVHLKPRRSPKHHQVMQNYIQTTNWNYSGSNAIHCKKNVATSKLERILTYRVSATGHSLSPQQSNHENMRNQHEAKSLRAKQKQQKQEEKKNRKRDGQEKKPTKIQLATAYKKTFKYNTTVHQILKNVTKKQQSQNKLTLCLLEQQRTIPHNYQLKFHQQKIQPQTPSPNHSPHRPKHPNPNPKNSSTTSNSNSNLYPNPQQPSAQSDPNKHQIKATLFEWRSLKSHYTKLNWRRETQMKRNLRESGCGKAKTNMGVIEGNQSCLVSLGNESTIDCLFKSFDDKKLDLVSSSPLKQHSYRFQADSNPQTMPSHTTRQTAKKSIQSQPNYSFLRNKKLSLKANITNTEFSVEAWHTIDKQRQWDEFIPLTH